MKIIVVLLDGLGDRAYKALGCRTPLQAAATPNLDRLAQLGSNGLYNAGLPGQCFPSETAHFLLFGYPLETFPGRGLLEAVGKGVPFEDRDVLLMAHLCHVTWQDGIPFVAVGRKELEKEDWGLEHLYEAIIPCELEGIRFRLQRTRINDGILVAKGSVCPWVSDSDPMVAGRYLARVHPLSENPEWAAAERTALALNRFLTRCHKILQNHSANQVRRDRGLPSADFLVTLRPGRRIIQDSFEKRWGLRGMVIASGAVFQGLAWELGLAFTRVTDSDDPGRDLRYRVHLGLKDKDHDFVHIHTKAADEAAHAGDPLRKMSVIAALDRGLEELVQRVAEDDDLLVAVVSDHSTPSVSDLIHSGESVPVTVVGPGVRRDGVSCFDEIHGASGCLGLLHGEELLRILLSYADRSVLEGHRLGPRARAYYPSRYEPFCLTDG